MHSNQRIVTATAWVDPHVCRADCKCTGNPPLKAELTELLALKDELRATALEIRGLVHDLTGGLFVSIPARV